MKALKYIGLGGLLVLLTIGCSDFLKEYSQDTYYVSSCEDLDELLTGDGYLPVNGLVGTISNCISREARLMPSPSKSQNWKRCAIRWKLWV